MSAKAEWRLLRGWSEVELRDRLRRARRRPLNFSPREIRERSGWTYYRSRTLIAREAPGPPVRGGAFEHARHAVENYAFSDPRIVIGHFDPDDPLEGRRMLLEIRVLGLRYLCGVVVSAVLDEVGDDATEFGYRYDTLEGHIESGSEWFRLRKDHATGEVRFRIEAVWRPGDLPNWWSRLGFRLLARRCQRAWHRLAYLRLRRIVGARGLPPLPRRGRLVHVGPFIDDPEVRKLWGDRLPPAASVPPATGDGPGGGA